MYLIVDFSWLTAIWFQPNRRWSATFGFN